MILFILILLSLVFFPCQPFVQMALSEEITRTALAAPQPVTESHSLDGYSDNQDSSNPGLILVEGAILHPLQSATVSTEVSGIIERFNYEEGDVVRAGETVVEISEKRCAASVERAKSHIRSLEASLKGAKQVAKVKHEVFSKGLTTSQELLAVETIMHVKEAELKEAKQLLQLAILDLKACKVKAPFTGHVDLRHKQAHEAVERLEKVFDLVDSTQLYAVVNVPESLMSFFQKGHKATFVHPSGAEYQGTVQKIGNRIDPKSRTSKVHVLISNSSGGLGIGMSGILRPSH